ncbi:MAG: hypothetical protein QXS02_03730 [Candidatus Thermoplasmatota archaeon]
MKKTVCIVSVILSVFFINISISQIITGRITNNIEKNLFQLSLDDTYQSIQKKFENKKEEPEHTSLFIKKIHAAFQYQITPRMVFIYITTILTEFFIYLLIVHKSPLLLFILSVLINTITNPVVNIIYNTICKNVLLLETGVFLVEILLILILFNLFSIKIGLPLAVVISLLSNLLSYIVSTNLANIFYSK